MENTREMCVGKTDMHRITKLRTLSEALMSAASSTTMVMIYWYLCRPMTISSMVRRVPVNGDQMSVVIVLIARLCNGLCQ